MALTAGQIDTTGEMRQRTVQAEQFLTARQGLAAGIDQKDQRPAGMLLNGIENEIGQRQRHGVIDRRRIGGAEYGSKLFCCGWGAGGVFCTAMAS